MKTWKLLVIYKFKKSIKQKALDFDFLFDEKVSLFQHFINVLHLRLTAQTHCYQTVNMPDNVSLKNFSLC